MALHQEPAHVALTSLADQMELSVEAAALGVIDVANANIDRALRRVSVARGYDPRDFTLVSFGGAGPMHACAVAQRVEIPRILVPRHPGVLCAFGLLMADVVLETSQSVLEAVTPSVQHRFQNLIDEMTDQVRAGLEDERFASTRMVFNGLVDARYQGQSYELTIPFTANIERAFHKAHARSYGHAMEHRTVEIVNLRVQATGLVEKPTLTPETIVENDGTDALLGRRPTLCDDHGNKHSVALYDRDRLRPGAAFAGPALVFQLDSTVFVAPHWSARVDGYRNIVLEKIDSPQRFGAPTKGPTQERTR
jgi:N-methylhydantoinase A